MLHCKKMTYRPEHCECVVMASGQHILRCTDEQHMDFLNPSLTIPR